MSKADDLQSRTGLSGAHPDMGRGLQVEGRRTQDHPGLWSEPCRAVGGGGRPRWPERLLGHWAAGVCRQEGCGMSCEECQPRWTHGQGWGQHGGRVTERRTAGRAPGPPKGDKWGRDVTPETRREGRAGPLERGWAGRAGGGAGAGAGAVSLMRGRTLGGQKGGGSVARTDRAKLE